VTEITGDQLAFLFLAQNEQTADAVLSRLIDFMSAAKQSLDLALYDLRLSEPLKNRFIAALAERARGGVQIRICVDGDKPLNPDLAAGQDPAPPGTSAFVQSLGYPWKRIAGTKLMHHKFVLRDREAIWTGSLNLTDDAFTLMENNVVLVRSAQLGSAYAKDFDELWRKENFENTGTTGSGNVPLIFDGRPASVRVMFSPGCGLTIDKEIAQRVLNARRRVRICSLLVNSGSLISAVLGLLRVGRVKVDGIFDRTQMEEVYHQWEMVPQNRWKIQALQEVIARAGLVGKNSTPYKPTALHDFMHNKILVIDDSVVTGSYNFSRSAQFNAENILFIDSAAVAECYSSYIDHLVQKYRGAVRV
jgi:hypothetical protein